MKRKSLSHLACALMCALIACGDDDSPSDAGTSDAMADVSLDAGLDGGSTCVDTICGEACVDLDEDLNHCGACDSACGVGEACDAGICALSCPAEQEACGAQCFDTTTSDLHCGGCDNACVAGEACSAGVCELSCATDQSVCGDGCVDTQSSNAHCGGCDIACDTGSICDGAGSCAITCAADRELCEDSCVDVQTSLMHCGACGSACGRGELCVTGACRAGPAITSVEADSGPTTGLVVIRIIGTGLDAEGLTVTFDGNDAAISLVSESQLDVELPANRGNPGPVDVVVADSFGREGRSVDGFTYFYGALSFADGVSTTVGATSSGLAVVDLNGDTFPDFASSRRTPESLQVAMGLGDGTFGAVDVYPVGVRPVSMTAVDLNGDNAPEIAVSTRAGSAPVSFFSNLRDGTFDDAVEVGMNAQQRSSIAFADFDDDGNLDFTTGGRGRGVVRFGSDDTSDPAFTFSRTVNFGEGEVLSVSFGEFDAVDGLDLVFVDHSADDDRLAIITGDGSGTFSAPTYFTAGDGNGFLYVFDFNEDGNLDVVMTSNSALLMFIGDGSGSFAAAATVATPGTQTRAIDVADFNLDGHMDLLLPDGSAGTNILLGVGDGTFGEVISVATGRHDVARYGDLDGDGRLDVVVASAEAVASYLSTAQ